MNFRPTRSVIAAAVATALLVPLAAVTTLGVASASDQSSSTPAYHDGGNDGGRGGHNWFGPNPGHWGIFRPGHDDTRDFRNPGRLKAPTVTVNDTSIMVTWQPPRRDGGSPVDGYIVVREVRTDSGVSRVSQASDDTLVVDSLAQLPAGRVRYAVAAVNADGPGGFSPWTETLIVVPAPTPPIAVTTGVRHGQVAASWHAPRNTHGTRVTSYRVDVIPVKTSTIKNKQALLAQAKKPGFWNGRSAAHGSRVVKSTQALLGSAKRGYTYVVSVEAKNAKGRISQRSAPTLYTVR